MEDRGQQKLVFSFHHVGTGAPTQIIKQMPAHCELVNSGPQSPNQDIFLLLLILVRHT